MSQIAFEQQLPDALRRETLRTAWREGDAALPALYISHGAPPLFEDAAWIDQLSRWADALPVPRGILIVSAHWEAAPLSLSAVSPANVVYDFGGFDPRYYRMRYDTPEATELAAEVLATVPDGWNVHQHTSRGLDHGAWVPLKVMYPGANVPVLQLSLPTHDPDLLIRLGSHLRSLRERGILIIGSGFMTHGLPYLTPEMFYGGAVPGWSREFDAWAAEALADRAIDELAAFQSKAPGLPYAHPTVEHFTPLFVTLGAAEGDITMPVEGYAFGLSKRSLQVA
jgi:4,5-DOPA dioxygenase extradiol